MKRMITVLAVLLLFAVPVSAAEPEGFDTGAQLEALGKNELMGSVPEGARDMMEEAGVYDMSVGTLLQLSPREFFRAIWGAFVRQLGSPLRSLASIGGIVVLCAFMNGMGKAAWDGVLSQVFGMVAVLCVILSVGKPILDCVTETSRAIQDASFFMTSFVPFFSAALMASGQPVTGATYNMFLFTACQVISQVVAQTLVPLLSVYLGLCIAGALAPEINISSATAAIKKVIGWALGFVFTVFAALLSIQTIVSAGADSVTTRSAKFLLSSFVPVVGGALSEAFISAQACLKLIKTCVGAYGVIAVLFIFLPVLLKTFIWYVVANLSVVISDILGVSAVSAVLKSCSAVLGILSGLILCYALLVTVSATVVMATGLGTA